MGIAVPGAACLGAACLELEREGGETFMRLHPGLGRGSLLGWGVAAESPVLTTQAGQAGVGTRTLASLPFPVLLPSRVWVLRPCVQLSKSAPWPGSVLGSHVPATTLPPPLHLPPPPPSAFFCVKALKHCCPAGALCHLLQSEPASRSLEPLEEPRARLSRVWQM